MEKIIGSKILFKGKKFMVKELTIELEPGKIVHWEIVDKGGDSVAMIPIDDEGNVYLVEEYFGATNERTLCLPKGMINKGETPAEAALRELQEEIGVTGTLHYLVTMSVSPGYLSQKTIVFLVSDLRPKSLRGDEEQYIRPIKMPMDEALQMIRDGKITEARTIGGITLAKLVKGDKMY